MGLVEVWGVGAALTPSAFRTPKTRVTSSAPAGVTAAEVHLSRLSLCFITLLGPLSAPQASDAPAPGVPGFLSALSAGGPSFSGAIVETVPAKGYLYQKVREPSGAEVWVVSMRRERVGEQVRVVPFGSRSPFHSAATGRDFDVLLFAVVTPTE